MHQATGQGDPEIPALKAAIEGLQAQLALMRERLDDKDEQLKETRGERDDWKAQAQSAQRLLADQRPRRSWFGWRKAS